MTRESPLPPQVPGYPEALARGLLPRPGSVPPRTHDGLSAGSLAQRWIWGAIAGFFGFIGSTLLLARSLGTSDELAWVMGGGSAVVLVGIWVSWGRVGRRALREYQAGYATLLLQEGVFWMRSLQPWSNAATRVLWDFSATWVLDRRTGAVVSAPAPIGVPPGLYPSPIDDRRWELWTGRMWSGVLVSARRVRLEP